MTIFSLALADLLSSCTLIVLAVIFMATSKYTSSVLTFIFPGVISSQLHIVIITIERLIAVIFPLKVKTVITSPRCAIALIFTWILSISLTLGLERIGGDHGRSILALVTLTTGAMIVCSYSFIIYSLIKRRSKILPNTTSAQNLSTVLYSLNITVVFIVSNYPWVFMTITTDSYNPEEIPFNIETVLLWLNLVIDPIIYFLFHVIKNSKACCSQTG